ncbi:MAG: bifunctional adenosylcobinamide kinase/adenosylcobinamide-phosphate guanylyltransferase, partial [Pyrinomonadaceae bacterium]
RHLDDETQEREILNLVKSFAQAASRREVIAVTNEVGSGIVPETRLGRTFRDTHGHANQLLAREAGRVILMVASLPLVIKDVEKKLTS